MSRLDELREKFKDVDFSLTEEKARFARAALAIKAGVEALGPEWTCSVDVWNREVRVRVGSMGGSFTFDDRRGGCEIGGLRLLLQEIRVSAGAGDVDSGYRALYATFAKWHPDYMAQFFQPPDMRPLPLP